MSKHFLFSFVVALIVSGCTHKPTECVGEACPCELECDESYAPYGDGFSSTHYNDAAVYYNHFHCHVGTIKLAENQRDTVMVTGWMYRLDLVGNWGSNDTNLHNPLTVQAGEDDMFFLTDDSTQIGGYYYNPIQISAEILDSFVRNFDEYLHRQLYISGTIETVPVVCDCCSVFPLLVATHIDTVPKQQLKP